MQPTILILQLVLMLDLAMGIVVFFTNRGRTANQQFLLLSLVIGFWIASVTWALLATTNLQAERMIRMAFFASSFIPTCFNLLRHVLVHPDRTLIRAALEMRGPMAANLAIALLTLTPLMMSGVRLPEVSPGQLAVAEPVYGPGFPLFSLYFLFAIGHLVWRFTVNIRQLSGLQRVELQFMLLGSALALVSGSGSALILPLLTGSSSSAPFAPIGIVLHNLVVAYGIATHRIMEVPYLLRRLAAYTLLCIYLSVVYLAVFFLVDNGLHLYHLGEHALLAHVLATLAVTFSMSPATTRFQDMTRRLFVNVQSFDFGETAQQANRLLSSISTMDELTRQFCSLIGQSFGTDRVALYLRDQDRLRLHLQTGTGREVRELAADDPTVTLLQESAEPIVRDILYRLPPTPALKAVARRLAELEAALVVGVRTKDRLEGLLLLGPRLSGRIFGTQEQKALRVLGDNLAVALENARLYTEVQDGKRYNEALLENLVSGVIATDTQRRVTVFNREAQRITRLDAAQVLGHGVEHLPAPLREALQVTNNLDELPRDQEVSWRSPDGREDTTVRVGGVRLRGHTGQALGTLLVIHDVSAIKKLEAQVRRTDRLASLGTLSAGMAHEIKNPLVTLKTFTQLLPERYDDPDFRNTFSSLLGEEVRRIDSLVNQLLRFARPTKPTLVPLHLHQVAEHTMKLVHQQARQKNITCRTELGAGADLILGDHDLLVQSLLNLLFNAMDAMGAGGVLTLSTDLREQDTPQLGLWGQPATESFIRLTVRDTGPGIRAEDLPHVFDPFFTTKSSGTGLGLSVAHGIIQEHRGLIDVESQPGVGTAFHLVFPLAPREAAV